MDIAVWPEYTRHEYNGVVYYKRTPPPGEKEMHRYIQRIRRLRRAVYSKCNFSCVDCGKKYVPKTNPYRGESLDDLTLGHIVARIHGGRMTVDNLVAQCLSCNNKLGDRVWTPGWKESHG